MSTPWKMTFDLNTLDHLGVKLYKHYSPIIAELISNSWDADATEVNIYLYDDSEKKIIVSDNGNGMTSDELQNNFLKIGRNRRLESKKDLSEIHLRPILGKKGIGKLSMFGLADEIKILTIKNNLKNSFLMNYKLMKSSDGNYAPDGIIYDEFTEDKHGTSIELSEIKRADSFKFEVDDLKKNLARRFSIFDDKDFNVYIYHNNKCEGKIQNDMKYQGIKNDITWEIPNVLDKITKEDLYEFFTQNNITGTFYASNKTLDKKLQGITLLVRGKLAEENTYFYDRAADFFHDYFYGELNIDYIDESLEEDNISTDRKSLLWEEPKPKELRKNLSLLSNHLQQIWRKMRKEKKEKSMKEILGFNIDEWQLTLNEYEKPLASELVNVIIDNDKISEEEGIKYLEHIKDVFSYESFKNYAAKLKSDGMLGDENVLKLLNDWEYIESKELAKVAEGRIKTILEFKNFIDSNASETKVIQPFFEKFPWVLDSKMNSFEREYTLGNAIKDEILSKEANLNGINPLKRIDFFVTKNSSEFTIYELKTPNVKINKEMADSIVTYISFSKKFLADKYKKEKYKIRIILITNNTKLDPDIEYIFEKMIESGDLIFKTYNELLQDAQEYHKHFILKYEELMKIKKNQSDRNEEKIS
ncbi:ATP-binding protein [Fusobacterium sp. PH5-44]|uniref:ATP-binding protein n=1 Tax=unclassified Fusobacterium TaxID=2648384 RepID=UPI003D1C3DB5